MSRGRLIAGFAAGYIREEFAAAGVDMRDRGRRMDDYLRAMRALWSMDRPAHHGPYVTFSGVDAHPRPVQRSGPPVVIGGESPAALRRAVTMGPGWYGFALDIEETRDCLDALRRMHAAHERPAELGRLERASVRVMRPTVPRRRWFAC